MFTHHRMGTFFFMAAFGLGVVAVPFSHAPGSWNSTSTHQHTTPTHPPYADYGPDVKYAKYWPTNETTTTTPRATVIAHGARIKPAFFHNSTSTPQPTPPSHPPYADYGPDVKYAKYWPTNETTTTTPRPTVIAHGARINPAFFHNSTGSPQPTPPSHPPYPYYGPGAMYRRSLPTNVTTTATPHATVGSVTRPESTTTSTIEPYHCQWDLPKTCEEWIGVAITVSSEAGWYCIPPKGCFQVPVPASHGNGTSAEARQGWQCLPPKHCHHHLTSQGQGNAKQTRAVV